MVDQLPTETERNRLAETLRTVTAGKIYVEVERARLTKRLVTKLEAEKKLEEAWTMIMELQVETYGSMEIKEKVRKAERRLLDNLTLATFRCNSCCTRSVCASSARTSCAPRSSRARSAPSSSTASPTM